MKHAQLLMLLTALCAVVGGNAQSMVEKQHAELQKSHKMILFGEGDADSSEYASLIDQFYEDQFRHAQDPRAPYFMLLSRDGKMAMGVGGQIKAYGMYDWHGSMDGTDFIPYDISMQMDPARVNLLQTSIGGSSLFFSVFGNNSRFGKYQLYIEAKFTGDSHLFKLKKAYATVGDFTLGYTKSTFVDPASQPSTVETQGPNSAVDDTRFLLRYMHTFKHKFTFAISAEQPDDQVPAAANLYEGGSDYMPNFAAFLQYGTSSQHLRLSGVIKGIRYRNLVEQRNGYATGWGVNLTTVFHPASMLTVYAAANTGQGIGSMIKDLSQGDNTLLGLADDPGKMYAPTSYGWYAALQYNFKPNLFSTLVASQERILPRDNSYYDGEQYKYGLYGVANLFWEIVPRCQLGAEFAIGKRVNIDGAHRMAYRASLMAQFSF